MKEFVMQNIAVGSTDFQAAETPAEILVPMDFSACSLNALQTALRFASQYGAEITLLHVIDLNLSYRLDTFKIERQIADEARANFARIIQQFADYAVFNTITAKGRLSETILKIARQRKSSLIILGKRARTSRGFFRRNTVGRIIEKAPCDVIAVAEDDKEIQPRNHALKRTGTMFFKVNPLPD
jgi:nucleotide-binding universal stress UspA family protein